MLSLQAPERHYLAPRLSESRIQQVLGAEPRPEIGRPTESGIYRPYFFATPCVSADSGFVDVMGDISDDTLTPDGSVGYEPGQFSESISVGVTSRDSTHQSYASFIDFKVVPRLKETVVFGCVLQPIAYQNRMIVFTDSTRKKFKSVTNYEPRNKPVRFSETTYMRPRRIEQTYVSSLEQNAFPERRWYQSTLQLVPVMHSSSHVAQFDMNMNSLENDDDETQNYDHDDTVFANDVSAHNGNHVYQNGVVMSTPTYSTSMFVHGASEHDNTDADADFNYAAGVNGTSYLNGYSSEEGESSV